MEVMKLDEMLRRLLNGPPFEDPEGVFVRLDEWMQNPYDADLFVFTFEEAEDFDEDSGVPLKAKELGLRYLLVISDLESVVYARKNLVPSPVGRDYVEAINYYRENDSFWPG